MELIKGRGYYYSLHYYLAWYVMGQKELLTEPIREQLLTILKNLARENKINIVEYQIKTNSVVLHISCTPQQSIPDIVKTLKGVSGRLLIKALRTATSENCLDIEHIWEPTYYITTDINDGKMQIELCQKKRTNIN